MRSKRASWILSWPFAILLATSSAFAEGDHGHEPPLHFAHPLITESPSPDNKVRIDYVHSNRIGEEGEQHTLQVGGEYAYSPSLSIEAALPYTYLDPEGSGSEQALDSAEVALKCANFTFADRGLLLGGGLELGLPTGDDSKGIGSNNVLEVEPFLDFGYKRGRLQTVGVLAVGFPTNADTDEADREYAWNLSFLYHVTPWVQALLEFDGERIEGGEEGGFDTANVVPGVKVRPIAGSTLTLGAAVRLPLGVNEREFHAMPLASVFYHF